MAEGVDTIAHHTFTKQRQPQAVLDLSFHNFIDFKKASDRVWHADLLQVLRGFNTDEGPVQAFQALYENFSSTILLNSQLGGGIFKTTVGVRQGCLLAPVLFNLFLEKIMQETLHDHDTSISIGGRPICNLRFVDDIDLMGGSNDELQDFTNKLVDMVTCEMEVSTEKSKIMTNSANNISADIIMNG